MGNKKIRSLISILLCLSVIGTGLLFANAEDIWFNYRNSDLNMAITQADLPDDENAVLNFAYSLKDADDWATNVSDILIVDGKIHVAVGDKLNILSSDGQLENSAELPSFIGYNCRMVYADGKIIIPLADADLVAVDAKTLQTVWKTNPVTTTDESGKTQYHNVQSTIAFDGENLYVPTVCFDATYAAVRGELLCVNAKTGDIVWCYDNQSGSFYWVGAVVRNGIVVITATNGIMVFSAADGKLLDSYKLSDVSNAAAVYDNGCYYAVSKDGVLTKFTVSDEGKIGYVASVKFAYSSTSTPVIYNSIAYACGAYELSDSWEIPAAGVITAIDVNTMTVVDSQKTSAEVKASALLGVADGVKAYFTCNAYPGGLYAYSNGKVSEVYIPNSELQNYCMASPVCNADGDILYINDSGALFSVGKKATEVLKGDINGDGKIQSTDARLVLRIAAKIDVAPANAVEIADMTNDGLVNSSDARIILRIAAHIQ